MSLQEATRYQGISAKAYQHPADRAATAALRSIPLLDKAVKYLSDLAHERLVRQLYIGNAVQVSDRQVPLLWARHVRPPPSSTWRRYLTCSSRKCQLLMPSLLAPNDRWS